MRATRRALRDWRHTDGAIWLHLVKTVTAALAAMGIAMLFDLPQPRIAMTTVCVLMQPLSGMVFAKSVYRIIGTIVGMIAAVVLGAVFVQQPELYIPAITAWVALCTAAAMRYRHFRWYAFVLAGYTAALIGIPVVTEPNELFLAALGRGAEVAIGIVCSGTVSAVIVPRPAGALLERTLRKRYADFTAFASRLLTSRLNREAFEEHITQLVDDVAAFEATRASAIFEDPTMRSRGQLLARLNGEFMDACARLYALRQSLARLYRRGIAITSHIGELAVTLAQIRRDDESDHAFAQRLADTIESREHALRRELHDARRSIEATQPDALRDFDTSTEFIGRFIAAAVSYSRAYAALMLPGAGPSKRATAYVPRTSWYVVAFSFVRTSVVLGALGWFWVQTNWPSGGLAMIAAALTCALASSSPSAARNAAQMTAGAACAAIAAYVFMCYVYPNIDGFPLLCAVLAPLLATGAFIATRPRIGGYGIGFSVFFCLLAGPDNVIAYRPDLLINNGIAVVTAMLVSAISFAVIFPPRAKWLTARVRLKLRAQVGMACHGDINGLALRFQSGTHDLMHQLRMLLSGREREHRRALRWMLVTLEVGHAMIDLRHGAQSARWLADFDGRWPRSLSRVRNEIARLFERPDAGTVARALKAVREATAVAEQALNAVNEDRNKRGDIQRIVSYLHFIESAVRDCNAPFIGLARHARRTDAGPRRTALGRAWRKLMRHLVAY